MARTKKQNTDPVSDIVQSISYGTGLICAKVTKLSKVAAKNKEWKEVVSTTQGLVKNAGDSVKNSLTELKESFDEGVKSIVEEANDTENIKPKARNKNEDIHDVEVLETQKEEEKVIAKQEAADQLKQAALNVEEIHPQEPEVVALPNELEPEGTTDIDGDLMGDEDSPKEKTPPPKSKKKVAKVIFENNSEPLKNPSEFTLQEFKKDGKDPKGLMGSIKKNKPEINLTSTDPLEWLNELLNNGDNGQPLKYDIQETPEIKEAKEAFENASGDEKNKELIKLNRLILEQAYPLKCPKNQIEEPKLKSRRSKGPDTEVNLN